MIFTVVWLDSHFIESKAHRVQWPAWNFVPRSECPTHFPCVSPFSRCSTLILQSCGAPDSLLLQPQVLGNKWPPWAWEEAGPAEGESRGLKEALAGCVEVRVPSLLLPVPLQAPGTSCLAWTSGPSERQLQREAAEALVGLKDSSQAPRLTPSVPPNPAWISLLHPCGPPGNFLRRENEIRLVGKWKPLE